MENTSLKPFETLTDEELLALTREQIDWYIKLKKAEAGVRIVNCPETPQYRAIPDKDMTLFDVAGFNFEDRETAEEVAKLINSKISKAYRVDYEWSMGSDKQYARPYEGNLVDVKIENVYKQETYNGIKDVLVSNKKIEKAYQEIKDEYDEQESKSSDIINNIYNKIDEARRRKQDFEMAVERIKEYLRLSNGDTNIAWAFYEKAYEIDVATKNKVLANEDYLTTVKGYC